MNNERHSTEFADNRREISASARRKGDSRGAYCAQRGQGQTRRIIYDMGRDDYWVVQNKAGGVEGRKQYINTNSGGGEQETKTWEGTVYTVRCVKKAHADGDDFDISEGGH